MELCYWLEEDEWAKFRADGEYRRKTFDQVGHIACALGINTHIMTPDKELAGMVTGRVTRVQRVDPETGEKLVHNREGDTSEGLPDNVISFAPYIERFTDE